jgi:predicted transcriptional regulator
MADQPLPSPATLLGLTATIVAAHAARSAQSTEAVQKAIAGVFATLDGICKASLEPPKPVPAVPIAKSVTNDYIVCLEDGTKHKLLRRHLANAFDLTPEEYRARWGLPPDYPMVAPAYSKVRRRLAKAAGLGTKEKRGKWKSR